MLMNITCVRKNHTANNYCYGKKINIAAVRGDSDRRVITCFNTIEHKTGIVLQDYKKRIAIAKEIISEYELCIFALQSIIEMFDQATNKKDVNILSDENVLNMLNKCKQDEIMLFKKRVKYKQDIQQSSEVTDIHIEDIQDERWMYYNELKPLAHESCQRAKGIMDVFVTYDPQVISLKTQVNDIVTSFVNENNNIDKSEKTLLQLRSIFNIQREQLTNIQTSISILTAINTDQKTY